MTDEPNRRPNDRTMARRNRLRDALRENLKRRKSQSRGRVDHAKGAPQDAASGPNPSNSSKTDPNQVD